ncbi:MAG: OmcA/MtrC family decaheme c-type cytochrome [Kofleriaceae bacterium]
MFLFAGCEGPTGPAGAGGNALTSTTPEPAGAHCANGGTRIDVGLDENTNGTLDESEVTSTSYVCNGNGTNSLVRTTTEAPGSNCPAGGTKIESGLDTNNNGVLDDSEVIATATAYVCNSGPGAISPSEGINVTYKQVSTTVNAPVTVRFVMKDDRGFPLDVYGAYSVNTPIQPRFALSYFTKDGFGTVSPLTVYTKSTSVAVPAGQPTNYNPLGATGQGTLVENGYGAGDYTYTFPTTSVTNGPQAVAYDPAKLDANHVVWMQVTRQTDLTFQTNANTFYAANPQYNFIPSGNGTPGVREIASQAKCDSCHAKFQAETVASAAFHGGGRVDVGMCNVCHNPARTSNPQANSSSFIHRIHNGEHVAAANQFHGIAATYPQDVRNCDTCHGGAAQGAQALTNLSQLACKGCHDYVAFDNSAAATCGLNGNVVKGADGIPLPCNHVAGPQLDTACVTCHGPAGGFATTRYHKPVVLPDPNNLWKVPVGGNANTNASFVAEANFVPTGASKFTYDLKSVDAWTDTTVVPNVKRPSITFKLKKDGTDIVFNTFPVKTELFDNFVGSPSAYFAWAVAQDGKQPTDFNASASGYIKNIWNGSATGAGGGTLSGPDATGYYTLKLTGVQIAPIATMLTGGLGYTYSLSGTPPLVQTNLIDYPWTPNVPADGKAQGGLSVPAPNVWKVATGYTARRAIVETAKCNACHAQLGVGPTFHAGQRNDGPTCSFCHNPNRTSSGWAAGSKYFIHAIHAGRKRVVPYTWHAAEAGPGYDEVEFPGTLNACTTCHTPNTFDFTNPTNLTAFANEPLSTVATGKYDTNPLTNSTYYTVSPYVVADNVMDYGAGFAYNAATNVTTQAAGTTLVLSPLTGACSACHDSNAALDHMKQNGGYFYAPRSTALAPNAPQEQCMICHGPGRVAAIGVVHQH